MPEHPPVRIRVDGRERASRVPEHLASFAEVQIEFAQLPTADYLLSDTVAVERKEAGDFAASIMDRRLFEQAARLKVEFERAVFVVEGDLSAVRSQIAPDAIRGALSFLAVLEGFSVLQAGDSEQTAHLLRVMARHAQHGLGSEVALRGSKPRSPGLYARYLVEGLPGVGPGRARALLRHFGSARRVLTATTEELSRVPGIGTKGAERIAGALDTPVEEA